MGRRLGRLAQVLTRMGLVVLVLVAAIALMLGNRLPTSKLPVRMRCLSCPSNCTCTGT